MQKTPLNPKRIFVSRLLYVILTILVGLQLFKLGKEKGKRDFMERCYLPELQIIPHDTPDGQLILIRQIIEQDQFKSRVRIDGEVLDGVEVKNISESGWGNIVGRSEMVSLWLLSNRNQSEIEITAKAFTNLPEGFSLKSDYHDELFIRLKPQGRKGEVAKR